MNARYFIDTNVFVYTLDRSAPAKSQRARQLIGGLLEEGSGVISSQVAHEFFSVALRKFKNVMAVPDADAFLRTVFAGMKLVPDSLAVTGQALQLRDRYRLPWYDALLVSAAMEGDCEVLYTEDFQHNQQIETVRIVNPFA